MGGIEPDVRKADQPPELIFGLAPSLCFVA